MRESRVESGGPFEDRATRLAFGIVSRRWNLDVVHCLRRGPLRFTDLKNKLAPISPTVLSSRLQHLTDAGVVTGRRLDFPPTTKVYELTEQGRALDPVVDALISWGLRRQGAAPTSPASPGEPHPVDVLEAVTGSRRGGGGGGGGGGPRATARAVRAR